MLQEVCRVLLAASCIQSRWRGFLVRRRYSPELDRRRGLRIRRQIVLRKAALVDRSAGGSQKLQRIIPVTKPQLRAMSALVPAINKKSKPYDVSLLAAAGAGKSRLVKAGSLGSCAPAILPSFGKESCQGPPHVSPRPSRMVSGGQQRPSPTVSGVAPARVVSISRPGLPATTADVPLILGEMLSHGTLSDVPRPPPWQQEQADVMDFQAVRNWLTSALPNAEVGAVFRVQSSAATAAAYAGVQRTLGPERHLWHGTSWDAVANIAKHGFNRAYSGRHGSKLGRGTYFAEDPTYALRFCGKSVPRAVFLAGVLPGRFCKGEEGLVEPPTIGSCGARYDSTVDDVERPRVFCVFRDFQAVPLYLVEIRS